MISLIVFSGKTTITVHMGDWARFQPLLSIPTKASAGYFSLNDVIESKNLGEVICYKES